MKVEAEIGGMQVKDFWQTAEAKRHGRDFYSEPPEGINLANTLISDFRPPKLLENKFIL